VLCLCVRNGCVRGYLSLLCWFRDCVVICEITGFEIVFGCWCVFPVMLAVLYWLFCRLIVAAPLLFLLCRQVVFIKEEPWPPSV